MDAAAADASANEQIHYHMKTATSAPLIGNQQYGKASANSNR